MSAESKSEVKARLNIAEFECSPEKITKILGIQPTKTWIKGEPINPIGKRVYKENGWMIESPINPVNSNVDEQVESLLSVITPYVEAFANLPSDVYIELSCVIYVPSNDHGRPTVGFSANTIKILAKLGANIDIDIYAFGL